MDDPASTLSDQDATGWSLTRLIDHVVTRHHTFLRANTAQNAAYARKIAVVHGGHHPELVQMAAVFDELTAVLTTHLNEQEDVVFPAIRQAEAGGGDSSLEIGAGALSHNVETLVRENAVLDVALDRMRDLAMGYALPPDACSTWVLTYRLLQTFEADLREHIRLENDILFPRLISQPEGERAAHHRQDVLPAEGSAHGMPDAAPAE
jgi:regulator of cell morphogenesis and NO signaling